MPGKPKPPPKKWTASNEIKQQKKYSWGDWQFRYPRPIPRINLGAPKPAARTSAGAWGNMSSRQVSSLGKGKPRKKA